ncbi:hypothetical protein EV363DRAFT_1351699 [Boletus edulis]|nr:hypothetical protein EV363DRAFT_1351699 [Boletus edulis]
MSNSIGWIRRVTVWAASASGILSEEASEMSNSVGWEVMWKIPASEILSQEASEETVGWEVMWKIPASEILSQEASEESGQSI